MRILRFRELAQGYTAVRVWTWDLNQGGMIVWPALLLRLDFFIAGDQPQLIQGIRRRDGLGDYLYAN